MGIGTQIAYCVTKQVCTYDAPVARCPTKDNVMCSVDLTVVFRISDAEKFVYNLGASRFDQLLTISVDEKVRKFIRQLDHKQVHEVRGAQAKSLLGSLNEVFESYGVIFLDIKITSVWLPDEITSAMEQITKHSIQMENVQAAHEFQALQVTMKSNLVLETIKRENEQEKIREASAISLAEIHQKKERLNMEQTVHTAVLKAEERAQVMEFSADAHNRRSRNEAKKYEKQKTNEAKSNKLQKELEADGKLIVGIAESYSVVVQAKEKAKTIELNAQVEEAVGPQVALQRQHELSLESKKVLARLAQSGDYNMVGETGDKLITSLLGGGFA